MPDRRERQWSYDMLLWWVSERGSAKVSEFAAACQELELDPWHAAWALGQLGHAEFDWHSAVFSVCPPVLTTIPRVPGWVLACGQRTSETMERLYQAAEGSGFDAEVTVEPCHQFGEGPGTILVEVEPTDAAAFAEAAGMQFVPAAHARLAALLPRISAETIGEPEEPDERFPAVRVDPDSFELAWDDPTDRTADGLWRVRTFADKRATYLREGGRSLRLAAPEYGPYLLKAGDHEHAPARWQAGTRVLSVDGFAPLPALHARAACLCSGRMPLRQRFAPGAWEDRYVNVDEATARAILTSLGIGEIK